MAHRQDRIPVRHAKKAFEECLSEWFYIEDVALPDPVRMGLPEFSSAPLKKRHSWRPRSLEEEDSAEVRQLMDFRAIFLLGAPRAPTMAFLHRNARKFGKTHSDWVGDSDVLNIEPF